MKIQLFTATILMLLTFSNAIARSNSTTFGSDGRSYTTYGDTTFDSDGTSYTTHGNTTFSSDGTSYTTHGNTTFGSDGTSYTTYGDTEDNKIKPWMIRDK